MQTKLEGVDKVFFAVGIGWSYIASVPGTGFFAAETFGKMTGILLIASLVSYLWKGRKRNWHGMAVVFVIVCIVWSAFVMATRTAGRPIP